MNKIEINTLLDFYGGLLTEKQQVMCRYYFRDDYSYQEIAEIMDVSRAAVYDIIKRCRSELTRYEEVLQMQKMSNQRKQYYEAMLNQHPDQEIQSLIALCYETENEGGNYE